MNVLLYLKNMPLGYAALIAAIYIGDHYTFIKSCAIFLVILSLGVNSLKKIFDLDFIVLLLFCAFYQLFYYIGSENKSEVNPTISLIIVAMYAFGRFVGIKIDSSKNLEFLFFIAGVSIALPGLQSVINEIMNYGFTGGARSINLSGDRYISATVMGGTFILLISFGVYIFSWGRHVNWLMRVFFIAFFIAGILASIRLGSRTLLIVALTSVIIGIKFGKNKAKHSIYIVASGIIILFLGFYFAESDVDFLNFYRDRLDSEEDGAATAGGRLDRWINSLELMLINPFGWDISINGYSHNLWLDVARNGGWLCFCLILFFNLNSINYIVYFARFDKSDSSFIALTIAIFVAMFSIFFVEPIMDGFGYIFGLYCFVFGCVKSYYLKLIYE